MAAIFDFNGNGRLGRERNLYQGGCRRSKVRRGVGVGEDKTPALCRLTCCFVTQLVVTRPVSILVRIPAKPEFSLGFFPAVSLITAHWEDRFFTCIFQVAFGFLKNEKKKERLNWMSLAVLQSHTRGWSFRESQKLGNLKAKCTKKKITNFKFRRDYSKGHLFLSIPSPSGSGGLIEKAGW